MFLQRKNRLWVTVSDGSIHHIHVSLTWSHTPNTRCHVHLLHMSYLPERRGAVLGLSSTLNTGSAHRYHPGKSDRHTLLCWGKALLYLWWGPASFISSLPPSSRASDIQILPTRKRRCREEIWRVNRWKVTMRNQRSLVVRRNLLSCMCFYFNASSFPSGRCVRLNNLSVWGKGLWMLFTQGTRGPGKVTFLLSLAGQVPAWQELSYHEGE